MGTIYVDENQLHLCLFECFFQVREFVVCDIHIYTYSHTQSHVAHVDKQEQHNMARADLLHLHCAV